MKSVLSLSVMVFSAASFAATLSCEQLGKAYRADAMNEAKYECNGKKACESLQLAQLRKTVEYFVGDDAEMDVSKATFAALKKEYQPIFSKKFVGDVAFDSVDIDLGGNPFEQFFDAGTTDFSGITSSDGSIEVDGQYCEEDFSFEPYITSSSQHALCREIAPAVREALPKSTFNHKVCVNETPVDKATGNRTSFDVERFTSDHTWVRVSRNLHDVKGGYFVCKARLSRQTKKVIAGTLSCEIH